VPDGTTLLLFAAAAAVLVAIPGPNHVYIATRSLGQGRGVGLASALGVEAGTLVHIGAAAAGLSALIASSAVAFDVVKYLGAAYLIVLGMRALRGRDELDVGGATAAVSLRRAFAQGVLVNVLNPKVALFFLAFLPQFVDPAAEGAALQVLVLGLVLSGLGLTSNVVWVLAAGALGTWLRRRPAFLRRQRYVTGGVYLALGATAALAGRRT
jgi:threonine/homoserine/homoserine lactone efflux protein